MKKSVVLTIGVIYLIAIVVVGFIGIKLKIYNETVYVDSIECISDNYKKYDAGSDGNLNGFAGRISVKYTEGLKVLLKFKINPENATEKKLDYIYDTESPIYQVTENKDGTAYITFLKPGAATITVKATDNKGVKIKIKIIVNDF